MFKQILSLAAAMLIAVTAWAIPAKRVTRTVTQPDGTRLTVVLTGDESFHCYRTTDGMPLTQAADGSYCYATISGTNVLSSGVVAHEVALRTPSEASFVTAQAAQPALADALQRRGMAARNAARRRRAIRPLATDGEVQKRRGLVILINFQDKKMYSANTREEFDKMMNQVGYTGNGNAGSVHDYFLAQSYGKFDLTFDVVGPVTVSKKLADYGANVGGDDKDPAGMVYEACKLADSQVNFADYDWDGDGEVDQVFVICAGQSEAAGGSAECIWPHEWNLYSGGYSLTLDGVRIDTYGCSTELNGTSTTRMDGIGTACHEFSHCMGLPDMYDVDYSNGFGMSYWSIMDSGAYNGDGYAPSGYTAYERWTSGWLQPVELKKACTVTGMPSLDKEPVAYVIYNDANRNEYYLLENRQQDGWFAEDEAKGVMVTHVDFDANAWYNNSVNDIPGHQRCTVVPADNSASAYDLNGDLYPYRGNNALTNTSSPAATLFNANTDGSKLLNKPVTSISISNGLASFAFMGGLSLDTPTANEATDVAADGFTAGWQAVDKAETYTLELRPDQGDAEATELCHENFDDWGTTLSGDSNTDISAKIDNYTTSAGWSGTKLFLGPKRLKLGSSSVVGKLITPVFGAPATERVSVKFSEQQYGRDINKVVVQLLNSYGTVQQEQQLERTDGTHVVTFEGVDDDFRVAITTTTKRIYLTGELIVCDGDVPDAGTAALVSPLADTETAATTQVVKGLTTTTYTFTSLPTDAAYKWRVRAEAGTVASPWSTWQKVVLGKPSGISQAASATDWTADTQVEVIALSGQNLGTAAYGRWHNGLPAGTYLLRAAGRTVVCVK